MILALLDDPESQVQVAACVALGRLKDLRAEASLIRFLEKRIVYGATQWTAEVAAGIEALAEMDAKGAIPVIARFVYDVNLERRVFSALGRLVGYPLGEMEPYAARTWWQKNRERFIPSS